MNFKDLPIGDEFLNITNAVVEIPKGERNKYDYDVNLGVFRLNCVLYFSIHYPEAYGVVVEVMPIGILRMEDEKGPDENFFQ